MNPERREAAVVEELDVARLPLRELERRVAVRGREALAEQIHELAAVGLLLRRGERRRLPHLEARAARRAPRRRSRRTILLQATMVSSERLRWVSASRLSRLLWLVVSSPRRARESCSFCIRVALLALVLTKPLACVDDTASHGFYFYRGRQRSRQRPLTRPVRADWPS